MAAAALVSPEQAGGVAHLNDDLTLIVVPDPFETFIEVLREFRPTHSQDQVDISPNAWIHPSVRLGDGTPFQLTLDDARGINNKLSKLSPEEVISIANQYRRARQKSIADELMIYQHNKFSTNSPRKY